MLRVVDSGGQAALLAPTEVLAQQHHRSITAMLGDLAAGGMLGGADEGNVALLTGSMTKAPAHRADAADRHRRGRHRDRHPRAAEEQVSFADLGLVVVDEQHRFGVEQRAALTDKAGTPPHVLVMTATPIPRTVAMTVFGDLEVSTLTELPAGRAPIQTNVVPLATTRAGSTGSGQRVREEVGKGHQVYVVCPRISGDELEEGETDQLDGRRRGRPRGAAAHAVPLAAVEAGRRRARRGPARRASGSAMLHGRMAADEKDRTMRAFAAGEIDVLVVDDGHRGRRRRRQRDHDGAARRRPVRRLPAPPAARPGRPRRAARAVPAGHPRRAGSPARERLDAVAATTDGFELSRIDLEQRREGDVLGRVAVRLPLQPGEPARAPRREDDRRGPRRRRGAAGRATRRSAARPTAGGAWRAWRLGAE